MHNNMPQIPNLNLLLRSKPNFLSTFILITTFLSFNINCFNLSVLQPIPSDEASSKIYINGQLQFNYNDSEYKNVMTCRNGQLSILEFDKKLTNPLISLKYQGIFLKPQDISISAQFVLPYPTFLYLDEIQQGIVINTNCLGELTDKTNYYNKVDIFINDRFLNKIYAFSFLMGCDKGGRNKKFQIGYILIAVINAAITIGVALHSRIWSIRYKGRPLSVELRWLRFMIIMLVILVLAVIIYVYAKKQFDNANKFLTVIGLVLAYICCFICADEIFFLIRSFKREVWKFIRICDLISFIASTIMFIVGFYLQDWIYYDILSLAICVGAIKLFRFRSMKQAFVCMATTTLIVTIVATVLHFKMERSYNDYTSELASPLFIQIPDMVQELYKKCSWLPVIDVIVPGVFLSFLRTYDENYNTGWGGVYTVVGNISFVISTFLWIILEAIYPYSIPFSLITYFFLCLSIWIISRKRNQLKTLWEGRFNGANNEITFNLLNSRQSQRTSFGKLVTPEIINAVKVDPNDDLLHLQQSNSVQKPLNHSQP